VVFESLEDLAARIEDPALDVTRDDFLVLKHAGPRSPSECPKPATSHSEEARASGGQGHGAHLGCAHERHRYTARWFCTSRPDAASGGPLALVRSGDHIALSVAKRSLTLRVDDAELARRRTGLTPAYRPQRGYAKLYAEHVTQADAGCDFDFLRLPSA
jgi:dihydroxy-acid dehydratase